MVSEYKFEIRSSNFFSQFFNMHLSKPLKDANSGQTHCAAPYIKPDRLRKLSARGAYSVKKVSLERPASAKKDSLKYRKIKHSLFDKHDNV
jgi:hypothetical protein